MKVRARITLLSDYALGESDYAMARALRETLAREWNARHKAKIDCLGLVVLYRQDPEYDELRRLFLDRVRDVPPTWLEWSEVIEAVYSKRELEQFEVLQLWVNGDAGLGGNTYARVYDINTCEACGLVTVHRQLQDLVVDLSRPAKDIVLTQNFHERLISERLCRILKGIAGPGVELRPVLHARPSRPVKRMYYQLTVHDVIQPLLAPRQAWLKRCASCGWESDLADKGTEQPDPWTNIHRWNPGPWDELHFPRSSYLGWDLMRTAVMFGGPVSPSGPGPEFAGLLVSQRLYRLLRQHKVTGYWVCPAHLD